MKYLTIVILALIATAFCATPDCAAYCTSVMTNCVGTTDKQYSDNAACMAVCAKLPLGASDGETSGNTVGCRQYHAGASAPASSTNSTTHCPHAGPSGGDVCGSKCDAYCSIIQSACNNTNAAYASTGICMAACGSFSTTGAISDVSGISYYCHLYHATVAITDTTHCAHAAAAGSGPCGSRCENYCQIIQKNCNTTQFADANTCMGFCATNPDGDYKDTVGNTKDCRIYHAFAGVALSDTATHCPHAGHSGAGVCGTYCETYCNLALNVCNGTHQLYATPAACTSACAGFATTGKPGDVSGNTVQCRIYHLGAAAALNDRATHCPHGSQNPTAGCNGLVTTTSYNPTPYYPTPYYPTPYYPSPYNPSPYINPAVKDEKQQTTFGIAHIITVSILTAIAIVLIVIFMFQKPPLKVEEEEMNDV